MVLRSNWANATSSAKAAARKLSLLHTTTYPYSIGEYYQKKLPILKHKRQVGIGIALLIELATSLAFVNLFLNFYKANCWNWFSDVCLQKFSYALIQRDASILKFKNHMFAHKAYR